MQHVVEIVTSVISSMGYVGVLIWMTIASACIPIPSEAIMPFAGALIVTQHKFNFHLLALVGAIGNLLGSWIAYWIGAKGGRPFIEKYGKYVLLRQSDVNRADHWFAHYGEATAFFSRMIPVVRAFISLPAGISRMNFARFSIYSFLGGWVWCYVLTYAGLKLGEHWKDINHVMHKADLAVGLVFVLLFGFWLWHHFRPEHVAKTEPSPVVEESNV